MEKKFIDAMRQKLHDMKADVLKYLLAENSDFRAAVEDSNGKDLADIASNDIDAWMLETIGAKDRIRLQSIESALARLETGRFGICAGCGSKIGKSRLEAIPYVVLCIQCQAKTERTRVH